MKIETTQPKPAFQPVTVSITCETPAELAFWAGVFSSMSFEMMHKGLTGAALGYPLDIATETPIRMAVIKALEGCADRAYNHMPK